jgi:hypothetical protein
MKWQVLPNGPYKRKKETHLPEYQIQRFSSCARTGIMQVKDAFFELDFPKAPQRSID